MLPDFDLVLVMTVEPGFGGQNFIAATVPKIRRVRALLDRPRPGCELEADRGIHAETAALTVEAGAHTPVTGSAIFEDPAGVRAAMARLRAGVAREA